jgi:hypothetical protein
MKNPRLLLCRLELHASCLAAAAGLALLSPLMPQAAADVFHLTGGGRIEGELISSEQDHYEILTPIGTVRLPADSVQRIEPAPSPLQEYRDRAANTADTPEDQYRLAMWCANRGLHQQKRQHLLRAIELDPDHVAARRALGFLKVGDWWVEARTAPGQPGSQPAAEEDSQKLAAAVELNWKLRIAAIKSTLLDSPLPSQVWRGRERILQIHDPMAIAPLVQVLSGGNFVCRSVLVEALDQFSDDAATLNLAALALADPAPEIREAAVHSLVRRQDPRIVAQFRQALATDDDTLVRRAAAALGALRASEAVPDLINALTARRLREVELPLHAYLGTLEAAFPRCRRSIGSTWVWVQPTVVVTTPAGAVLSPGATAPRRLRQVTVQRTEVLEALRRITGQDFGFDQDAWARWYEEQQ